MYGPKIWIHECELDVIKRLDYKYGPEIGIHKNELDCANLPETEASFLCKNLDT